jgi:Calx-beta domain
MKTLKTFLSIALSAMVLFVASCSKKNDPVISTLKFSDLSASYAEDKGVVNIVASLSSPQSSDVIVNYSWSSPDTTTYLGGDFSFLEPASFTVKAGQTTSNLQVQIIDDKQIDADDMITLVLTSTNLSSVNLGTSAETSFNLTMTNNDITPSDKMQIDLTWHTTSTANINDVNLDLLLQQNVVYDAASGTITNVGTPLTVSANTTGYETIFLKSTDKDQAYFLAVNYTAGSSTVTFVGTLNGFGYMNSALSRKLPPSTLGKALFVGPFTKSGSKFTSGRRESPNFYLVDSSLLKGF